MLVSRISPAPRSAASRAQATASRPVGVRPPATYASQLAGLPALASIATTTHCAPKFARQLVDQLGPRERRRVDRDLVGAGVEHRLGVGHRADPAADRERDEHLVGRRRASSTTVSRLSEVAVMSRNTSSSAPAAS